MYPFVRFIKTLVGARRLPPLEQFTDTHISQHRCWPWDVDMYAEMNNGRILTLNDLGRLALGQRIGLIAVLAKKRWGMAVAGASVRYRRRIPTFQRYTLYTRALCWDERFLYLEQAMYLPNGECANHVLYRTAVLEKRKAIDPARVAEALGHETTSPPMPAWVQAWINAETQRPWPPMQDAM